eukprot:snap_masked-scaffold_77-processed-gene-0.36-mRNA-1 protein AED:1.00 eAED:1.00 QI:0/0/0/0/1/1/3/0/92
MQLLFRRCYHQLTPQLELKLLQKEYLLLTSITVEADPYPRLILFKTREFMRLREYLPKNGSIIRRWHTRSVVCLLEDGIKVETNERAFSTKG